MSPTEPDRPTIWRGGAIHFRSEEGGHGPETHAHFAIQLGIGLRGPIENRGQFAEGWLVGPDEPHGLQGHRGVATILLDPLGETGRRLAARLGGAGTQALAPAECEAARLELQGCLERGWSVADIQATVGRIAAILNPDGAGPSRMDPRVQAVVDELQRDSGASARLSELASAVGLSESRLAHLFRRDVGIPMRQYRLSLRMQEAVNRIAQGDSLTAAAHAAGFADSAHFCRICRRMFGSAPSGLPVFR